MLAWEYFVGFPVLGAFAGSVIGFFALGCFWGRFLGRQALAVFCGCGLAGLASGALTSLLSLMPLVPWLQAGDESNVMATLVVSAPLLGYASFPFFQLIVLVRLYQAFDAGWLDPSVGPDDSL